MKAKKIHISQVNRLLHGFIHAIRIHRLGFWSETLDDYSALELHIIEIIHRGKEIPIGEIRKRVDIPKTSLSTIIKKLESKRLIERRINKDDFRSYLLSLTREGEELHKEHERVDFLLAEKVVSALNDENSLRNMAEYLEKIIIKFEGSKTE
jgi:DNA-binding MarR family transcriptional regulator